MTINVSLLPIGNTFLEDVSNQTVSAYRDSGELLRAMQCDKSFSLLVHQKGYLLSSCPKRRRGASHKRKALGGDSPLGCIASHD